MLNHIRNTETVYILENPTSSRIKVGYTTGDPESRLVDVNDKWLSKKATCQVCGCRRKITRERLFPSHAFSGKLCTGSNALPLEKDTALAKSYLDVLTSRVGSLSGKEKGSTTRRIKSIEKRLHIFENYVQPKGLWYINTLYRTNSAEAVEQLSHERLSMFLDQSAPFGEVFCCDILTARKAIEDVLGVMGLSNSAKKEIGFEYTSVTYGECPICGNGLTKQRVCPDCTQRLFDLL